MHDNELLKTKQSDKKRFLLFLIILTSGIVLLSCIKFFPSKHQYLFIGGFACSFAGMLGLRHYWPNNRGAIQIIFIALIARCLLLPIVPSDDVNRYIWEGKVQLHQLNPYSIAPENPVTEPIRDSIWQGINHKEYTSIYGPLAQHVFRLAAFIWYTPFFLKMILLLFDIGTLIFLLLYLKKRGSRINEALLYAVNPLVLYSFAAEGHLESMMIFMLAGAVLMFQRKQTAWMFVFLGCACSVKLTAAIFIPLFIRKDTFKYVPFVIVPFVAALPFGDSIVSIFTVTRKFATDFHFNGCAYNALLTIVSGYHAMILSMSIFIIAYGWIFFLTPDPGKACGNVAVAFLLTSPTAHAWYFTIVAMFAVLYPARSWIALTGTIGMSWIIIFNYWITGIWKEYGYLWVFEYLPSAFIELYGRWKLPGFSSPGYGKPESLTVIIPVLNEGNRLHDCLESITLPKDILSEIIVVDGGSTENTCDIARADQRVKLLTSDKGRGIQIAHGVDQAKGDLIIVLHADTQLDKKSVATILQFCLKHPYVAGGSVAAKFDTPEPRFVFITALNNFRSRFSGVSFGDQVQFFRKRAIENRVPRVKLMEDIEMSMLLKEQGPIAFLPSIAKSSVRRWRNKKYMTNIFTVVTLTALYIVKRRFGLLKEDNNDFYKAYYGK
jgi:hypothetical protein